MCRTSSVQMIQLHLEKKEYIWSPATFKGDLWRYIAFNPGIDLVALPNSGYPGGYLCNSFPNAMSISLASVPFIQPGLFTERRRGWGSCFRSNIFLIYPLVVTNRGDYGPLPFEKASLCPLSDVSITEPLQQYSAHQCLFQETYWTLWPCWVAWERQVFVLPAETRVLVCHKVSNWFRPSVIFGRTKSQVTGFCCDDKSIWHRLVQGKLLNIRQLKPGVCRGCRWTILSIINQRFAFVLPLDSVIWFSFLWLFPRWISMSHFHYAAAEHCLLV